MKRIPQKIFDAIEKIPPFPPSVSRILELTADIECSPRDLVDVIKHDPVLTGKMLKLVNSPYFGLSRKISTINQAVVFVGVNTIKNMALSVAALSAFPAKNWASFGATDFWLHCLATASGAKLLAEKIKIKDTEEYFVAGLLHDIGKMVNALFFQKEFFAALKKAKENKSPLYLMEDKLLGTTHASIGALLGKKWQLPDMLIEAIEYHHETPENPSPLICCVFAANQAAKALKYGFSGDSEIQDMPESLKSLLSMDFSETINYLKSYLPEKIEKAKSLIEF